MELESPARLMLSMCAAGVWHHHLLQGAARPEHRRQQGSGLCAAVHVRRSHKSHQRAEQQDGEPCSPWHCAVEIWSCFAPGVAFVAAGFMQLQLNKGADNPTMQVLPAVALALGLAASHAGQTSWAAVCQAHAARLLLVIARCLLQSWTAPSSWPPWRADQWQTPLCSNSTEEAG